MYEPFVEKACAKYERIAVYSAAQYTEGRMILEGLTVLPQREIILLLAFIRPQLLISSVLVDLDHGWLVSVKLMNKENYLNLSMDVIEKINRLRASMSLAITGSV